MKYFIIICLLFVSKFAADAEASGEPDPCDGGAHEYNITHNGLTYEVNYHRLEVYKPETISAMKDLPLDPGFKNVYIGVPKLEAKATDLSELDVLIERFDHLSFELPWYDSKKLGHSVLIRQPEGEMTGACVLLHGSNNVGGVDFTIANRLAKTGKLVLIPYLFGAHGISKVSQDQTAIPLEQSVIATYRILRFLKSHPDMADKKVSLIGSSRGAMVADLCARKFYQHHISPDLQFDQFIMIDGFILRNEEKPVYTGAPMLFMHGNLDTWTPLPFVERHVRILREAGYPVTLEIFEGGHHAFLEEATEERNTIKEKEVQTFKDCTFIDRKEKGFTPLVFDADSNTLIESDALLGWDAFPKFLMENMVASEKVLVGASGEHTERGLQMIEDFLATATVSASAGRAGSES